MSSSVDLIIEKAGEFVGVPYGTSSQYTTEGHVLKDLMPSAIKEILQNTSRELSSLLAHNFQQIAPNSNTPYGYKYEFTLPSDCETVLNVFNRWVDDKNQHAGWNFFYGITADNQNRIVGFLNLFANKKNIDLNPWLQYEIQGNKIVGNFDKLLIQYHTNNPDVFIPNSHGSIGTLLACKIAEKYAYTRKPGLIPELRRQYQIERSKAVAFNNKNKNNIQYTFGKHYPWFQQF